MTDIRKTLLYMRGFGAAAIAASVPLLADGTVALATNPGGGNTVYAPNNNGGAQFSGSALNGSASVSSGSSGGTWSPTDLLDESGVERKDVTGASVNGVVRNIAGWALGIAISLFVLRVVLTGIDRILVGNEGGHSFLSSIPLVGAYPPPSADGEGYPWKDVWINFAKNLAMVVGAWVIVNAVVGLVEWAMNSFIG